MLSKTIRTRLSDEDFELIQELAKEEVKREGKEFGLSKFSRDKIYKPFLEAQRKLRA